ncbi:hypothetical protein DL95DRAFT_411762 [Leptodontidium sp. 2 PMI_412]|nr:hypothetical protein DL95DRAFT_411762 [Leptodontidium sp. 2 PMI_412]
MGANAGYAYLNPAIRKVIDKNKSGDNYTDVGIKEEEESVRNDKVKGVSVKEEVVDNEGEVFNTFDDSGDKDYRESSKDVVEDSEGDLSEVEVDGSNNGDYEESNRVADDYEGEGSSEIEVARSGGLGSGKYSLNLRIVGWQASIPRMAGVGIPARGLGEGDGGARSGKGEYCVLRIVE